MFKSGYTARLLCFLITCFPLYWSQFSVAEDRSQFFQSFEIEGVAVGVNFSDAVAKAESGGYQLLNASARELTKKEADGSVKTLHFDMPYLEDEFPELKVVWRIAYQKKFPQTLNFEPDAVIAGVKQKYGDPDKDYQDSQGRHTLIYYGDASKKAEIRFETIKTWRSQAFNVTMSDVDIKTAGRAAYNEAKSSEASATQQAAPAAVVDY